MLTVDTRDPDRLLPVETRTRELARELYLRVADLPVLSPHGHVPAQLLAENHAFSDPSELLVTKDHYVTRLLHADGASLADLGIGRAVPADPRAVWRQFASRWDRFPGTASAYWINEELASVFGIHEMLTPDNADVIYDRIAEQLATPELRPQALFARFGIEVLATTDDALDDLRHHSALNRSALPGRVVPTFRPDRYLDATAPDFSTDVARLLGSSEQPATFGGYLTALESRRHHFISHGAVSADHGVEDPTTLDLDPVDARTLFARVLDGSADSEQRRAFGAHMLFQMARMSVEDGLVMTVHAGVLRNHNTRTLDRFGPDTGHDIPVPTSFTRGMRPLLEKFGLERDFHLVLFTVDETSYSRELAPLAAFYPSVYIGAPWWFLDAPDAIARYRSAVTETAGFYRTSGFIDDTRAFLSIPARHDTARRSDAAYLARLVGEGRITMSAAGRIIDDLTDAIPRKVFKL